MRRLQIIPLIRISIGVPWRSGKIPARRFRKGIRLDPCKQVDDSVVLLERLRYISPGNCVLRDDGGNEISSRQDSPQN